MIKFFVNSFFMFAKVEPNTLFQLKSYSLYNPLTNYENSPVFNPLIEEVDIIICSTYKNNIVL